MKNLSRLEEKCITEQYSKPNQHCNATPPIWEMYIGVIMVALLLFTTISCELQTDSNELIGNESNTIQLRITNEREIYIDNKLISIDNVGIEITKLTSNYSNSEVENYIVNLTVDKEVEIGFLTDVQQQLRDVNARRIEYVAIR